MLLCNLLGPHSRVEETHNLAVVSYLIRSACLQHILLFYNIAVALLPAAAFMQKPLVLLTNCLMGSIHGFAEHGCSETDEAC